MGEREEMAGMLMVEKGCKLDWHSSNSVVISGEIDEYADFSSLVQSAGQILYVNFARVTRLNSSGLRTWIQTIMKNKIQLVLRECSAVVVEQFALIPQFIGKNGTVESFYARYQCISCFYEELRRFQVGQNLNIQKPQLAVELNDPCPECGDHVELDQSPEVYLSFLRYSKPESAAS